MLTSYSMIRDGAYYKIVCTTNTLLFWTLQIIPIVKLDWCKMQLRQQWFVWTLSHWLTSIHSFDRSDIVLCLWRRVISSILIPTLCPYFRFLSASPILSSSVCSFTTFLCSVPASLSSIIFPIRSTNELTPAIWPICPAFFKAATEWSNEQRYSARSSWLLPISTLICRSSNLSNSCSARFSSSSQSESNERYEWIYRCFSTAANSYDCSNIRFSNSKSSLFRPYFSSHRSILTQRGSLASTTERNGRGTVGGDRIAAGRITPFTVFSDNATIQK